jgi:hypothetical protein
MLLFFKRLLLVAAVALMLARETSAFALLGAFNDWQVQAIGYDPDGDNGDLGGPKNLGEEYRWTTPRIYYAFDSSFIDYFGTNGIQAIRNAAELFNTNMVGLGDLTDDQLAARFGYDRTRQRFNSPVGRRVNSTAMGLGLLDLKTYAMGMFTEQLGMASPERWVYALRDRSVINNVTNYLIVQRNFDPFTFQPSQYVNGARFHYQVRELDADPDYADAVEIRVNQSDADPIPYAVANLQGEDISNFIGLRAGEFYETLTMDDVASLRYIYRRQNVNQEDVIPGTSFIFTDTTQLIFLQGFDLFTFWSNATVLSPAQLRTLYTNLVITSTNLTVGTILTTNRVITNLLSDSTLFTNRQQLTLVSNMDYGRFLSDARTNPPNALRALYPGLIITSTNSSVETVLVETVGLTNAPFGVPGEIGLSVTNFVPTLMQTFQYTFGNVVVRYSSTVSDWLIQDIGRSPFGVPGEIFLVTNSTPVRVAQPSGGFFILNRAVNPNLVGYDFTDGLGNPLPKVTNIFEVTNIVRSLFNPFTGDVSIRSITTRFTNVVEAAYEIVANSIIGQTEVDVVTRTFIPRFTYTFGSNFIQFPSADQTVLNREFQGIDGIPFPPVVTRVPSPFPIGAGIILNPETTVLDTNFVIITPGLATNTLLFFTNAANGSFLVREQVVVTNSLIVAANPVTIIPATGVAQRPGVDTLQLVEFPHRGNFLQQPDIIATNVFDGFTFTNGVRFPQTFRRVGGPDIVIAAGDPVVSQNSFPNTSFRNVNWSPTPAPNSPARPGTILPSTTITFSKLRPSDWDQFPAGWNTAIPITGWGSFDGTTKPPIVYPQDVTLQDLEAFVRGRNP